MENDKIIDRLTEKKLVPVIALTDEKNAEPLAQALLDASLRCMEITYRTDAAAGAISRLRERFPEIAIGAGTITNVKQAEDAVQAGSQYIVSPGLDDEVVKWCQSQQIPVIPGVATPTEVQRAMNLGLTTLKFFHSEASGGTRFLSGMAGPFADIQFIPSGGINEQNLAEYIKLKNVIAVGGSWFVKKTLIASGQFQEITRRTKRALEIISSVQV